MVKNISATLNPIIWTYKSLDKDDVDGPVPYHEVEEAGPKSVQSPHLRTVCRIVKISQRR